MDHDRAAAKRRASFGRADRLRKEAGQKAEQTKAAERRKAERDKADRQRKADAVKTAEQRNAQARTRAEQRRLERHRENSQQEFARKVETGRAHDARADRQRKAMAAKVAGRDQPASRDPRQRAAADYVAQQEKRHRADQQEEQRRQTARLRAEHQAERVGFRHREAAAIIHHAQKIRTIDLAERRELEALDAQRRSLGGRVVGLVRGSKHFARQEQAIVDRHEHDRWQKHRDHETRKDNLFWIEQAARLRQVAERTSLAKTHRTERQELSQAHERTRPHRVKDHVRAMERLAQIPVERVKTQEAVRPKQAFGQADGRAHELKR